MSKVIRKAQGMPASDGAGVKLSRIIGQPGLKRLDPFLMLDEFGSDEAQDYIAGFPQHPHRGFQTVTYMLEGKMGHKDSVGNAGVIEDGGLQWMNAGRGIIHEEMPQQTQGRMRGFQLWVNLPASEKMSAPGYQDIPTNLIPEVIDGNTLVRVLAGEYQGVQGPVKTQAIQPQFLDLHFGVNSNEDASTDSLTWPVDTSQNGFIYVYEGDVEVEGERLTKGQLGVLEFDGSVTVSSSVAAKAIVVSGTPIGEPIAQYGPFVMNTEEEIQQALRDYQSGALA